LVASSNAANGLSGHSTQAGTILPIKGGTRQPRVNHFNDVVTIRSVGGDTTFNGGQGNVRILVNYTITKDQTFLNGINGRLTLIGADGSNRYDIGLSGKHSSTGADETVIDVQN